MVQKPYQLFEFEKCEKPSTAKFRAFSKAEWEAKSYLRTRECKSSENKSIGRFSNRSKENWKNSRHQGDHKVTDIQSIKMEESEVHQKPISSWRQKGFGHWMQNKKELRKEIQEQEDDGFAERLLKFYTIHNPSKIASIAATLNTYQGREDELFEKLNAKYVTSKVLLASLQRKVPLTDEHGSVVFMDIRIGGKEVGRIVMRLLDSKTPLAANNFKCLCTGEKGSHLHYKGSYFHRIIPGFVVQGGDYTTGDGTGGCSIYKGTEHGNLWGKFKDEMFLPHDSVGLLSMANNGKNANGSQFFITTASKPSHLDNKHVVFGEVIKGLDVVDKMQHVPTNSKQRPLDEHRIQIFNCGQLE